MHRKWNSNSNTNSSPFSLLEIFPSFCVCVWFESFAATARTTSAEMQRCIGAYDIGIVKSAHITDDTLACESEINDGMSMSARTHSLLLYFVPKIKRCVCVRPRLLNKHTDKPTRAINSTKNRTELWKNEVNIWNAYDLRHHRHRDVGDETWIFRWKLFNF